MRVSDLLFALQKRWMIIVALSLVGLTFGIILSAMTVVQTSYQTYNINGSFAVTSKNINGQYVGGYSVPNTNDFHLAEDMVDAVRYVMRSERVLNEVINENELLGYTVTFLRNAITVSQYNSTQILEMRLTWRNAEEGLTVWNSVMRHASDILPETLQMGSLEIINEPRAEQIGVVGGGNNRVVLFTLLGFAAGVGFAIVELLMHPTLNNVRDVEQLFGVETIGVIPRDNAYYRRKDSIMTREDTGNSLVVQNFSAAAYILRNRLGTREEHHCFYVTSAAEGEGKTTVAANLAIQLSDMEHKTLLVDFNTRNPALGALFLNNVDYEHSLNALYRGDVIPEAAITTLSGYLDILPAVLEHNAINVDNMLVDLVEDLKQRYEYVILDAPPVGVVSGTLSLNQLANSVLFVIGYDNSSLPEIQSSLEKLDKSGTRVLGCIVNNVVSGRNLGMTQSADERKKNISRKAAKKKQEEEKFGFDDSQNGEGTPEEIQKTKAGRKRRKKKEKKAAPLSADKAGMKETTDEVVLPVPIETKKRNIYEDSIQQEEPKKDGLSTQDTINELVRMGLTNDWGSDETADQPTADETPTPESADMAADTPDNQPAEDRPNAIEADWIDLSAAENNGTPIQEQNDQPEKDEPDTAFSGWIDLSEPESENREELFKEPSQKLAVEDKDAQTAQEASKAEKRVVRTVNVKRRETRTVKQSAQPRPIVIARERADKTPVVNIQENRAGNAEAEIVKHSKAGVTELPHAPQTVSAEPEKTAPKADAGSSKKPSMIVTVLGAAALALAALLLAAAAIAGFAYGVSGVTAVLHSYTALADRLTAAGLSVSALTLGVLLLWLGSHLLQRVIPSFIRARRGHQEGSEEGQK